MITVRWGLRYVGVFFLSAAALMLQVSYTRIFSVALWSHLVWMILSIALLGYAASGTLLSAYPGLQDIDLDRMLTIASALFSGSILLIYEASNHVPFDPIRLAWDSLQLLYIMVYYILLTVPFLLSGLAMALAVSKAGSRINRLYSSSLAGSALGSILVLPLFNPLTGPGVIVFTSIVAGASALAFVLNLKGRGSIVVLCWMLALAVLLPSAGCLLPVRMSPYKSLVVALRYPDATLLETRWNAFSRVDVIESGFVRYAPGLSLRYKGLIPEQVGMTRDGDALDAITRYDGGQASLAFTEFLPASLPYRLKSNPRVLIIDAGGGLDVLTAIHHNSSSVVAVEANPIIVRLVQEEYSPFSGSIYRNDDVRVVVADGRSFIQRAHYGEYDIVVLSMVGGASPSSTGIYALTESYLYTVESFMGLIGLLSEDGYLSVSRWLLPPPREDVRIVSLTVSALEALGASEPAEHIAVVRSWGTITLLVGRKPLGSEQVDAIRNLCDEMAFDIVYVPGVDLCEVNIHNRFSEPIYYQLVHGMLHADDRAKFFSSYLYDISPATDERPFFFHFFKWDRLLETYESLGGKWQPLIEGGYLVPIALVQALILSVLFILLPLRGLGEESERKWSLIIYFFCLGLGYMFVEVAMIQKFILLLGHPAYSVAAVLFGLLLTSGLGSYISGRIEPGELGHKLILLSIGVIAPLFGLASQIIRSLLNLPISIRLVVAPIIIAPLGVLMGMPFPIGIRMLVGRSRELVPWAWAANGCASVLGSILPTILALQFGFSKVFSVAGATYIACFVSIHMLRRKDLWQSSI